MNILLQIIEFPFLILIKVNQFITIAANANMFGHTVFVAGFVIMIINFFSPAESLTRDMPV